LDYKIFNFEDSPKVTLIPVESHEPNGPFGALGVGEHSINPVAGVVANAVANAIGERIYEIPITPDRVLKALGKL
jgi:CO/xanthine dehydrogenase Mo-binding subunit